MDLNEENLAAWLIENGYAEKERGYGHVCGEDLAEALLHSFVMVPFPDLVLPGPKVCGLTYCDDPYYATKPADVASGTDDLPLCRYHYDQVRDIG